MTAFSNRTGGYKAGVMLFFFATCIYMIAFGSPYWAEVEYVKKEANGHTVIYTYHEGVWMLCITADSPFVYAVGCGSYGIEGFPAWFHIVRLFLALCIIGLITNCACVMAINCFSSAPGARSRAVEILGGVSGLLGFIGCMVYVGMRNDTSSDASLSDEYLIIFYLPVDWTFNWAFYMASIGSGLTLIASILIGLTNKPVEGVAVTEGEAVMMTVTAQPVYVQQAYLPPQGVVVQPPDYASAAKGDTPAPY